MNLTRKIFPAASDAAFYRSALRLPKPSADFASAEKAFRKASVDLRALVGRRESLKIEQTVDNPGRMKLPTAVLHATLKSLAEDVAEAEVRERETRVEFEALRAVYRDHARASLGGDIEGLGALINQHLGDVLELLEVAAGLTSQAREAGIEFSGLISDAPIARRLIEPMANTISKMISKGSRS
ncbi:MULTISPECIES: hypothetical protein [Mesorhizobium]|uniref:hypothetical protein n=1 Tax=Mesorhizobium TaxID=68287 RepID=UPI0003CE6A18|nr:MULTISPECIES: hypothetical protein [Mesorhizobium]ESY70001.1 hypothetical protein X742_05665 [Mesorhizobium sp. LNHC232B00]WJI40284.1 hypothetical protein NL534_08600 [Mesorhizobium opportunistum]